MTFSRATLLALCFAAAPAVASAQGVKPATKEVAPAPATAAVTRAVYTRSCPDMVPAQIVRLPDGGYAETNQGWFNQAWTERDLLMCSYGVDRARPADRPAVTVHYDLAGHKSADCKVVGQIISCMK